MLNKVTLKGNVGRTPKTFLTQEGKEIVSFSLATKTSWKDESGEWQSTTDWHWITVFRESTIRWIKDLLKRGDTVCVEGKLAYQHWTDKYGQPRSTPHVVVSQFGGKVEHFKIQQLNSQNNNLIPEKVQDSSPSLTENEDTCTPPDLAQEHSLSAQPYPQFCLPKDENKQKGQEAPHHKGEITYES
ncbi:MAG: single-stranded DNA-binding protein [Alphaproteobacteria bacterium]|nr:single-stranded DNA-binding protein [Alphaproteobacteria bacterium]